MRGRPLCCAVNPSCGRERLDRLIKADESKKVIIIGGGVAGMEAARVAALRGHKVRLYEQKDYLGGHLIEASVPRFKQDLAALLSWYKNELKNSGVDIQLGIKVADAILDVEQPDIVVVATGSLPVIPDIPGIEGNNKVTTCIDLLLGKSKTGEKVAVIGGGLVGCETALWLAQQGKKVTLIEMLPGLMTGSPIVPQMNKTMLLDLLSMYKVDILIDTAAQVITGEGLTVLQDHDRKKFIPADSVVLAAGLKPDNRLYQSLTGKITCLYSAGDCAQPRNILGAIWDGFEIGRSI
jgi:2-enoate reductase